MCIFLFLSKNSQNHNLNHGIINSKYNRLETTAWNFSYKYYAILVTPHRQVVSSSQDQDLNKQIRKIVHPSIRERVPNVWFESADSDSWDFLHEEIYQLQKTISQTRTGIYIGLRWATQKQDVWLFILRSCNCHQCRVLFVQTRPLWVNRRCEGIGKVKGFFILNELFIVDVLIYKLFERVIEVKWISYRSKVNQDRVIKMRWAN